MTTTEDQFQAAAEAATRLPSKPDNDTLLRLYALYKQATEGDVSGERPGFFDFVGAAKYEAWEKLEGTPQETAREQYVSLVRELGGELD
ncbi:MAG: acyl-CoA-binding protein [Gammaproteobacteria bacterium]